MLLERWKVGSRYLVFLFHSRSESPLSYVWSYRLNRGKIPFFEKSYPDTCGRGLSMILSDSLISSVVYLLPRLRSIFELLPFVVLFQLLRRKTQVEKAAGVTTEGGYTLI